MWVATMLIDTGAPATVRARISASKYVELF
jgi:hypothetical protein